MPVQDDAKWHLDRQRSTTLANPVRYVNEAPRDLSSAAWGRVGVVLDIANLIRGARARGSTPDFRRIIADVTAQRPWKAVACLSTDSGGRSIRPLLDSLQTLGIETSIWTPVVIMGQRKTNADALIVARAMRLIFDRDVSEVCICSGDSDFRILAEECGRRGKTFKVASYLGRLAGALRWAADEVVELDWRHTLPRELARMAA